MARYRPGWHAGGVKIVVCVKQVPATSDAKIDPVMALVDAVTVMSRNPSVPGKSSSYLETDDLMVL